MKTEFRHTKNGAQQVRHQPTLPSISVGEHDSTGSVRLTGNRGRGLYVSRNPPLPGYGFWPAETRRGTGIPLCYLSVGGTKSGTASEDRRAHDRLDTPRHQLRSLVASAGR